MRFLTVITTCLMLHTLPAFSTEECAQGTCESSWKTVTKQQMAEAKSLAEGYKDFLFHARTELSTVTTTVSTVKKHGFTPLKPGTAIKSGGRYYHINRDRALTLIIGGKQPVSAGVRIVASHIDSPRLELKARPLYDQDGFALFQTNYHGSIKTYQWTNVPLALMGRIDKKDGTVVQVSLGLKDDDPIFMIPDLAPHVAKAQMKRSAESVVEHEDLDVIVAHGPNGKDSVVTAVLAHLKATYGIEKADLVSAELALVPATAPRDMGFDRRLIAAYGQDDRLGAFASMAALYNLETPSQTAVVLFADNEESGNVNTTGAASTHLTDLIGELIYAEQGEKYRQPMLGRALHASRALSIDVNPGVNPMNPGVWELGNAPRLGYGVNIKAYGKGLNADSEFIAWTRAALDSRNIPWQTTTYKVGKAGGGTLGTELSRLNINTIDVGVPVLSIHTPYAVSDKMDLMALRNAVQAFLLFDRP